MVIACFGGFGVFGVNAQVVILTASGKIPASLQAMIQQGGLVLGWRNGVKPEYLLVSVGFQSLISFGGFALNREAPHQ